MEVIYKLTVTSVKIATVVIIKYSDIVLRSIKVFVRCLGKARLKETILGSEVLLMAPRRNRVGKDSETQTVRTRCKG